MDLYKLEHLNFVMPPTLPNIFIIDDDSDDSEMLSSALTAEGMKINTFNSGDKALAHLENTTELPTMIILDYNMPCQNGVQTMKSIKSNPATSGIPVVIFSTSVPDLFKETLIQLGAYNCFKKPFSYEGFRSQVSVFKNLADDLANTQV